MLERALKRKSMDSDGGEKYCDLTFILPTSNVCERLFSVSRSVSINTNFRLVLTDYRKSMTPYTFQCILSLKMNRDLWGIRTLQEILNLE